MKCPRCHFQNRDEAIFCNEYGYKLENICPNFGNTNRLGSKYCDKCGNILTITPPKIAKPPPSLTKPITDHECKYVTALFSDLSGSNIISVPAAEARSSASSTC